MDAANTRLDSRAGELSERLTAVVESSDDPIVEVTLDGVITSWNAGAARTYGYTAADMTGCAWSGLFPPGRAGELAPILDRLRRGLRIDHYPATQVRRDGAVIDMSISASPIRNADGVVVAAATVARDVTRRNRAEAAHEAMLARLQRSARMETVGQLTTGVAHDFNNLLGAIVNFAGLVAEATADRPATRADAEQIQMAAVRAWLTRELLVFSLRQTGRPALTDLNEVIAGVRELAAASLGSRVELRFALAAELPPTVADRGELEQVLLNLVANARDATPAGGRVTISTGVADLGDAGGAGDVRPGRYVELAVSDTGTGMSADVVAQISGPATGAPGHGTGLGMSTVSEVITQAGGRISVASAEGTGTTVHVYLPATGAPVPAPGIRPDGHEHAATILVVDDEPAMLRSTLRVLRNNGYYTLEAETGEEALSLASCHDFQLLLTDSVMPRMSGAELAELIHEVKPGVPVLHMSGYNAGALSQQPATGAKITLLEKPFTAETLLETVRAALDAP